MVDLLTDLGEEYLYKNDLQGVSLDIGLYDDSTDGIGDTNDIADITTEPSGSAYARQTDTFSVADISGDWGIQNDSTVTFDVSDSSTTVDTGFLVVNFQAEDTGDSSANDHLFAVGALSQSRDLSQIDQIEFDPADITVTTS